MLESLEVTPIKIDLPFKLNHVHCFLAKGSDGWTIIDTGLHRNHTKDVWRKALLGKKVTNIVITHFHPDHFGYAGQLQVETGAQVFMTAVDAKKGKNTWGDENIEVLRMNYQRCGLPQSLIDGVMEQTGDLLQYVSPYPNVDGYLEEGDTIQFGKYEYEVIVTPGHSDGLINLFNKEKSVLFSTDHVLPRITPNISYWFEGDPNPLSTYLQSLKKIKKLDAEWVIPSHGAPFQFANKRIDEILYHHEQRLEEVISLTNSGITIYGASKKLFRRELTVHELRFAIGETLSHLEYLVYKGECRKETRNGKWYYQRG